MSQYQERPSRPADVASKSSPRRGPSVLPALARRSAIAVPPDAETRALLPLVQRSCQALQSMADSLAALIHFNERLAALDADRDRHAELIASARETLAEVVLLLRREGPPLLFRAQALRLRLRLHGYEPNPAVAASMRELHADLDGLVALMPHRTGRPAAEWGLSIQRAQANTLITLAEFERHAEHLAVELYIGGATQLAPDGGR